MEDIQRQSEEAVELIAQGSIAPSGQRRKVDIEEIKDVFIKKNFRRGFSIFDDNKDGLIDIQELKQMMHELGNQIPSDVVKKIYLMSDQDHDGYINYNEFVKMVKNPEFNVLFGRYLRSYVQNLVPDRRSPQAVGRAAFSVADGGFEDQYSWWPPPISMIIISVIEIILFSIDMIKYDATEANGPMAIALMYNPHKRYEAWRYVTYMFVHVGYMHLCVNLIVQIMLGIPLEMVHKGWRVLIIYFAGVLAGSLGTSITDPSVYLAGASGGVYSLITAHIASVIMNWRQMSVPILQLLIFLLLTVADFSTAIYNRYYLELKDNIGFEAHVAGAIAGLLVGIFILRNLEENRCEKRLWWASLVVFSIMMGSAVVLNAVWTEHFPEQF